jgi:hypothetical protein
MNIYLSGLKIKIIMINVKKKNIRCLKTAKQIRFNTSEFDGNKNQTKF